MYIKILNKNQNHPNSDNGNFEVEEGSVFTETKNETLDNGTVIIDNLIEPIDIEPYDIVEIPYLQKYMCVDTYTETLVCINPKRYKYQITLFSETKQLENVVLPNLKITKVWGQTRSVFFYINRYLSLYCPKIKTGDVVQLEEFDSWWGDMIQWEGDHYEILVDFGTSTSSYHTVPVPTANLRVSANAWVYDGNNNETFTDDNCHIYQNSIDENGHWRILFGIRIGRLEGWSLSDLEYGSEDVEVSNVYDFTYNYKWSWDTNANQSKFNMQCPEMQWNTPTLREVLNDLMMVADCIPVIKQGEISYFDLTEVNRTTQGIPKNWKDNSHINYVTKSRSSEDYVSEIQCKLENVTNQTEDVNNIVTKAEWIYFSPEGDEVVLKNDNMVLKTQYPIYNLKSLTIFFPGHGNYNGSDPSGVNKWMSLDLVSLGIVTEYQKWITKRVLYNSEPPSRGNLSEFANSQNWSVYYTRNTKEIKNWSHKTKFWWQSYFLYEELCKSIIRYKYNTVGGESLDTGWYGIFFKVEYETLEGCLFRASKGELVSHERVVIDNQTNSMVDSYNQGFLEYQKANRLGNEQLQINARFERGNQLIYIGDMYDDSVIYQVQYQFYKNHIEVNALATKNYILREYFTGVKSKIRSWKISDASEACFRQELIKYYGELSYNSHIDNELDNFDGLEIASYLCSSVQEYTAAPVKYGFIRTISNDGGIAGNVRHPSSGYFNLDLISRLVGNSMVFTLNFYDNFWACQMLDTDIVDSDDFVSAGSLFIDSDALVDGRGFPLKMRQYTDGNGEAIKFTIRYSEDIKIAPYTKDYEPEDNIGGEDPDDLHTFIYAIWQKPHVYGTDEHPNIIDERFMISSDFYKDSQETIGISTQFEFCSDTTDIYIGKEWIKRQKAISIDDNDVSDYKVVMYSKNLYDFRNPRQVLLTTLAGACDVGVEVYSNGNINAGVYIVFRNNSYYRRSTANEAVSLGQQLAKDYCFYLIDKDPYNNEVLLGLNNIPNGNFFSREVEEDGAVYYYPMILVCMNVLKTRDKNIYDSDNHYLINRKM